MKKSIALLTILLITGVVALGQNAKPKPLSDKQMDAITAGNSGGHDDGGDDDNGGATATVTVSGAALSGVTTMNLVVSADSAVATGINVFSGNSNPAPTSPSNTNNSASSTSSKNNDGGKGDGGDDGDNENHAGLNQTNNICVYGNSKSSSSSVTLSDSAESGITATNIVNAASSSVASGINVAQTNSINTTTFNQVNTVSVNH